MILTFTANPSTDATLRLPSALSPGTVQRLDSDSRVAGGKGVNVSHVAHLAGVATLAIFPAAPDDPFRALVKDAHIPAHPVAIRGTVRSNITITDPAGTTTKLNGPGPTLSRQEVTELETTLCRLASELCPEWVVLAGSLPPGAPADWYAQIIPMLREAAPRSLVAVDTSDTPLVELARAWPSAAPDLLKPNSAELGQVLGKDGDALEAGASHGDIAPVLHAACQIMDQGVQSLLITLGAAGAALVTAEGSYVASPPPTSPVSTVGAGDSSLAGYLIAQLSGLPPVDCLRHAVAYGSAATALPGTTLPSPHQLDLVHTHVHALSMHGTH